MADRRPYPDTNFLSGTARPGPYSTRLSYTDELEFQKWVRDHRIPYEDTPRADYDMRGYFQAMRRGDPNAQTQVSAFDGKPHFPDTYKTPYHETFSNESMYATPNAPRWDEKNVLRNKIGGVIFDESKPQKR